MIALFLTPINPPINPRYTARMTTRLIMLCGALLVLAAPILACPALAQTYPAKPIRLLVPFPPGGPADFMSRVVGKRLAEGLGQQFVIENQSGGGGTIAAEAVARAPADGYTLVIGSLSTLVTNPILNPNIRYDPVKSFSPVSMITVAPSMLLVNPQVPANSLRELIELAKAKPGTLNFGSNGTGALPHLAGELFKSMTGVNIVHVPYKGGARHQRPDGRSDPVDFHRAVGTGAAYPLRQAARPGSGEFKAPRGIARCSDLCRSGTSRFRNLYLVRAFRPAGHARRGDRPAQCRDGANARRKRSQ
jgi:hypothetical protein